MKYPEKEIAQHLEGASASLEMALQEIKEGWGPYYEKMVRDIAIAQWQIDTYLEDMRQLTTI